jgi:hypothetical protein
LKQIAARQAVAEGLSRTEDAQHANAPDAVISPDTVGKPSSFSSRYHSGGGLATLRTLTGGFVALRLYHRRTADVVTTPAT